MFDNTMQTRLLKSNANFRGTGLDLAQAQRLATNKVDSLLRRRTFRLAGIHLCLDAYGAHHPNATLSLHIAALSIYLDMAYTPTIV
jgi:hypothetical protein